MRWMIGRRMRGSRMMTTARVIVKMSMMEKPIHQRRGLSSGIAPGVFDSTIAAIFTRHGKCVD